MKDRYLNVFTKADPTKPITHSKFVLCTRDGLEINCIYVYMYAALRCYRDEIVANAILVNRSW